MDYKLIDYCKGRATLTGFRDNSLVLRVFPLDMGEPQITFGGGLLVLVPVAELDGASVERSERGSMFMKWIKRTLDEMEDGKHDSKGDEV